MTNQLEIELRKGDTMKIGIIFTVLFAISACTSSHVLTGKARASIDPEGVKIYSAAPTGSEQIAILSASSQGSWALTGQQKMNEVVDDLKKEAAKLGANGVVFSGVGDNSHLP